MKEKRGKGSSLPRFPGPLGYIDDDGEFAINPQFGGARRFSHGRAPVLLGGRRGFVRRGGTYFGRPGARAHRRPLWVIGTDGKLEINPQFEGAGDFQENRAVVRARAKFGDIDKSGKLAINPQFDPAGDFSQGLAFVAVGNRSGYIDRNGRFEINPQSDDAGEFSAGLPPVWMGNRQGYIGKEGKLVRNPTSQTSAAPARPLKSRLPRRKCRPALRLPSQRAAVREILEKDHSRARGPACAARPEGTMAKTEKRQSRYREDMSEMPDWLKKKKCPQREKYLSGQRILPKNITGKEKLADLIDSTFLAYNSARLREGCQLFAAKMLEPDVTVGMSFSGALTPAGLGCSSIVPLIKAGFVDWIVSTGAILYHDLHFALNYPVRSGSFKMDDTELRNNDIVRVYDVLLGYSDCLMATDEILRSILVGPEFQKEMGTAELHYLLGKHAAEWERKAGLKDVSMLAAAYRAGVPCYTSSPGDSTIGMNVAGVELRGNKLRVNPSIDVNETTAYVLAAKRAGGKSAVVLWGGGSPKNFMLQTEPQIQEVLRIKEYGQDYFLQVTDARPDTGGLSGATPSEAVSWGKVDPDRLPDAVVCYTDTTIAMPLFTVYALARHKPRPLRRLYDQRAEMITALTKEYFKHNKVKMVDGSDPVF